MLILINVLENWIEGEKLNLSHLIFYFLSFFFQIFDGKALYGVGAEQVNNGYYLPLGYYLL